MPQNAFFLQTRDLLVSQKTMQRHFFFHPPSPFHGNFCNCNSIGICTASQFSVQLPLLYTAWSNAYSEIGPEVRCDLSRLLARKITKRIHSSKPASLNHPIPLLSSITSTSKIPCSLSGLEHAHTSIHSLTDTVLLFSENQSNNSQYVWPTADLLAGICWSWPPKTPEVTG